MHFFLGALRVKNSVDVDYLDSEDSPSFLAQCEK